MGAVTPPTSEINSRRVLSALPERSLLLNGCIVHHSKSRRPMTAVGPGRVKTKSDLVVMLSGGQISAFFCSERDHKSQNSGCSHTAQRFHTA
jgi:hypothetical protein